MSDRVQTFIDRWRASDSAERANFPYFVTELCDLLQVEPPHHQQSIESENTYVFERAVPPPSGSTAFIDLYKRGHFVVEAKQRHRVAFGDGGCLGSSRVSGWRAV